MVLTSHKDVIEQVRLAVLSVFRVDTNGFQKGVCYGYASMFIEAVHAGEVDAFYARFNGTLPESPSVRNQFFARLGFHQAPYLISDQVPVGRNFHHQNLVQTSRMKTKGGLAVPWTHSGFYDLSGMSLVLEVFRGMVNRYGCRFAFLLDGGKHTIALTIQKNSALIATVSRPSEKLQYPFKTEDDIRLLAAHLMEYIAKEKIKEEHQLIINWSCVSCKQDLSAMKEIVHELKGHPSFNYTPSKDLLSIADMKNRRWIIGAIRAQDGQMIKGMIQEHPPLKGMVELGKSLLTYCAFFGLLAAAKALLEVGLDPNESDPEGNLALHWVVANAHIQFAALLLGYQADIHKKNRKGLSPLGYAYQKIAEGKGNPPLQIMVEMMEKPTRSLTRL